MVDLGDFSNDRTCERDATFWVKRTLPASPSAWADCVMAYDFDRGVTVLFGGWNGTGVVLGDQWEQAGPAWTKRAFSTMPSARAESVMPTIGIEA